MDNILYKRAREEGIKEKVIKIIHDSFVMIIILIQTR